MIKKFIFRILLFFAIFLVPVVLYVVMDPFKVIYHYSDPINTKEDFQITLNRDYYSTELFLNQYQKYHYNSFIFGNSRSNFYQIKTWQQYIEGNCFQFNASSESIYGINAKLNLLDELHVDINNALFVIDASSFMETENSQGHLFIKHPSISKESNFAFQAEMFKGFFSTAIFAYTDLFLTNKKKLYMEEYGILNNVWKHEPITNQLTYERYDKQLSDNAEAYYADKMEYFYQRDTVQQYSSPVIYDKQKELLKSIAVILKKKHSNYKIIISPLYDQLKFNSKDLAILKEMFGAGNVYDFSGINLLTNDFHHYYEQSHYRPFICDSIVKFIYKGEIVPNRVLK